MFQLIWLAGAAVTTLGIGLDMHRLRVNRVGLLSFAGWAVAGVCIGPIAGAVYVFRRRATRRTLIDAVWQLVGDTSQPVHVRRRRLVALQQSDLVSPVIFRACSSVLDEQAGVQTSVKP